MTRRGFLKGLAVGAGAGGALALGWRTFLNLPRFGRLPQGKRLERILASPNYRDGAFRNRPSAYVPPYRHDDGRGGYDERFRQIEERFLGIDLAILENGQYNVRWQRNHMMPDELALAMRDLGAKRYMTGHHAKFCISTHPWDEPFANEKAAALAAGVNLAIPRIGEIVSL